MKNGTLYAKRVKTYYRRLRGSAPKEPPPGSTDPLEQLMLAQLSWDASTSAAQKACRNLSEKMIDLNEVRVSTVREIASVIREYVPNPMECARSISRSLNDVFRRENRVSLEVLKDCGRRDARQYLESLNGVNAHAAASVLLWSLGGHAVPVNQRLLRALRKEDLVDPGAGVAEVQAFLERHVAAAEAKTFCLVMEKLAAQKGSPPASGKRAKADGKKAEAKRAAKKTKTGSGATGRKRKTARR
jgi:endonuclease III